MSYSMMRLGASVHMAVIGFMTSVCIAFSASAQVGDQPRPRVILSLANGHEHPDHAVGSMAIRIGEWTIKPIYARADGVVRTLSLFAYRSAAPAGTGNINSILFYRPTQECSPWTAKTWIDAPIANVIATIKLEYTIGDYQDPFWDTATEQGGVAAGPAGYATGFVEDDPMAELVNASSEREMLVGLLMDMGYPVSDLPFEKSGSELEASAFLSNAAAFFDDTLERRLSGVELSEKVALSYRYSIDDNPAICRRVQIFCDLAMCREPSRCTPQTIVGEWEPAEPPCDCRTYGPWPAVCGTFTFGVEGILEVPCPYIPGGKITLRGTAGLTTNVCVCLWRRVCSGPSKRTLTHVSSNCTTTTTIENGPVLRYEYVNYAIATAAEYCAFAGPPADVIPEGVPCGMRYPTPENPNSYR